MSLAQAEALALARDPLAARHRELAAGLQAESIADGELPDPTVQVGMLNFPTDTFDRAQEPMTQLQVAVRQAFPPGDSLAIQSRHRVALAEAERARAEARARMVRRAVREAWMEVWYWREAERVVEDSRALFRQLVEITARQYAAGRYNQQDVVRAELELSALEDRLTEIQTRQDTARAELDKWIGPAAGGPLAADVTGLPDVQARNAIEAALLSHPALRAESAVVDAQRQRVALARAAYKPGFSVGVAYGARSGYNPGGDERPNFASATLGFSLPLFRDKRQDQRLAAAQRRVAAAMRNRDERLLQLRRQLSADYAEWQRLGERLALYGEQLLPHARRNAETSLSAYQNDRTDFTTLMRARIAELDTRLRYQRLRADRAKARAHLLYLSGEPK
ncbi:MAG: TolC family protein [Gammaproteobacteria bacterium]|nr:TolC family protein [Gammaproteobacteria bacterium]